MVSQNTFRMTLAWAPTLAAASSAGLLGPVFAAPTNLAGERSIHSTAANVTALLDDLFRTGKSPYGNLHAKDTALSVQVLSLDGGQPIVDYHHNPGNLNTSAGSTNELGRDAVYRIGSISKLFTAYTLLVNQGRKWWNTPVSEILPELEDRPEGDDIAQTRWDEVTVGALASHMGGVSAGYPRQDLASVPGIGAAAGFPPLHPDEIPQCSSSPEQPICTREQFFHGYLKQHPVQRPYTTAIYANAGYHLLGYVVEALTKSSFADALQKTVLEPLGLQHSSAMLPKNGTGVIPQGDSGWDITMGGDTPTGGLYSSAHDLGEFGKAILGHKQLSSFETHRWMKPHAHTALWSLSVGAPWEIIRTRTRTTEGHAVDLYTKSGGIGAYGALLVLIPDFGIVVPILAAGTDAATAAGVAFERVVQGFLPALEKAARQQTKRNLGGTYTTKGNSTLVLDVEDDPVSGLVVKQWISNGVDTLAALQLSAQSGGRTLDRLRLVPMDLVAEEGKQRAYRALIETTLQGVDAAVPRVNNVDDVAWELLDAQQWGGIGLDEFVFTLDEDGRATAVSPRAMREAYVKR